MDIPKIISALIISNALLSGCASNVANSKGTTISAIDGMEMIYIAAGEFSMGSAEGNESINEDEQPAHTVRLDAYWIDKTEVTNAMYQICIASKICSTPAQSRYYLEAHFADHPIIGVSWTQAKAYCAWAGRRLPTEAEWEMAARGTDGRMYPWGNISPTAELANFNQDVDGTSAVGSYPSGASPYGLLDMAGNAWEWVADGYDPLFYDNAPTLNPFTDEVENLKVIRGGNWNSNANGVRSANRFWAFPGRNDTDGFRCANSDKNGI